jgi:hypothetical protein
VTDHEGPSVLSGGSGIALEGDDSSVVLGEGEDSSVVLGKGGDSSLILGSESGISLEGPSDSGLALGGDDDEGITLALDDDSGISLETGDSGISLETGESGISLEEDSRSGTIPMMDSLSDDDIPETQFEIPSLEDEDSGYEIGADDRRGDSTTMLDAFGEGEAGLDDADHVAD